MGTVGSRAAALGLVASAAFASPAAAQNWPMPTRVGEPAAMVNGGYTYPYDEPIVRHVGRFVDSAEVTDRVSPRPRTLRGKGASLAIANGRVYVRLGETFAGYDAATFFTEDLGSPLVAAARVPSGWTSERFLPYDVATDPEQAGSGWNTYLLDGQERLFGYDWDDRGYVYVAYYIWGWGILADADFSLVRQVDWEEAVAGATQVIASFRSGSRYYVLASGTETAIWDVTEPTSPSLVRQLSEPTRDVAVSGDHATIAVATEAYQDGATVGLLRLYRTADLASGAEPFLTVEANAQASFTSVTTDGARFWATESASRWRAISGLPFDLAIHQLVPDASGGYERGRTEFLDRIGHVARYGAGYLAITGVERLSPGSARALFLYDARGDELREVDLGSFPRRYYTRSDDPRYVTPQYGTFREARVVRYGGSDYLFVNAHGLGDVYELAPRPELDGGVDGGVADAGAAQDGGSTADASASADASTGAPADAGMAGAGDAGAGVAPDAAVGFDGGGGPATVSGGCGCRVAPRRSPTLPASALLLSLVAALGLRRRR